MSLQEIKKSFHFMLAVHQCVGCFNPACHKRVIDNAKKLFKLRRPKIFYPKLPL